jgi:hypothetical protein
VHRYFQTEPITVRSTGQTLEAYQVTGPGSLIMRPFPGKPDEIRDSGLLPAAGERALGSAAGHGGRDSGVRFRNRWPCRSHADNGRGADRRENPRLEGPGRTADRHQAESGPTTGGTGNRMNGGRQGALAAEAICTGRRGVACRAAVVERVRLRCATKEYCNYHGRNSRYRHHGLQGNVGIR